MSAAELIFGLVTLIATVAVVALFVTLIAFIIRQWRGTRGLSERSDADSETRDG